MATFYIILLVITVAVFMYTATKTGMIDDVINFVKYEIFKMKR